MFNEEMYAVLREFKAGVDTRGLLAQWGAHAMGIGWKISDGQVTERLAVRIYVPKKRALTELSSEQEIPKYIEFQPLKSRRKRRIYTDVIETPPMRFQAVDPETKIRPVPGGVSGGISSSTGTIGGWVWDTTDDTIVMLSNEHVLGVTSGRDIVQPGIADGGSLPADKIGDVKRGIDRIPSVVAIITNHVDCAIGDPDSSEIYDLRVLEIGPAVYGIDEATGDMLVEKYGQTTRHTYGEVTDTDWEGFVDGIYYFDDCLYIKPVSPSSQWSDRGDSGSLVFSQTPIPDAMTIKPVVGLHFAGNGTQGVACKIQTVFDRLDLTTLCNGAFGSVSDSLFETDLEGAESEDYFRTVSALASRTATEFTPLSFVRRERVRRRRRGFYTGISREVQKRLQTSERGRIITEFVDENRAELLTLFARDGDVRRATLASIKPLVSGAITTSDVLNRKVTADDLKRLDHLGKELTRKSGAKMQRALKKLMALRPESPGHTLAKILEIQL